ncbi:MAG TPA: FAD:protein FMN transferase [Gammaproteobacteria bacterium]|nr:FAD:protein FMN transferase [Gammaproteobacteria bacterium]
MKAIRSIVGFLAFASVLWLPGCSPERPDREIQVISNLAQGTTYTIKWWSAGEFDAAAFASAIQDELARIDELLSNFREDSMIERFNASRTVEAQALPEEMLMLLRIAAAVHRASAGCFDPTVRPLVALWGFDTAAPHVPHPSALAAARTRVGFDKLELIDTQHVRKTIADLEIDMAGIGQGYTVARLAQIAAELGLDNYLIEIGGELAAHGGKPNDEPWRVGIEQPLDAQRAVPRVLILPTERTTAVMTSGTYRHFFEEGGQTYSHILDPKTGRPVQHDLVSVTVLHSDPTLAGAWSTALLCLGPEQAAVTAEREGLAALLLVRVGESIQERRSTSLDEGWLGVLE